MARSRIKRLRLKLLECHLVDRIFTSEEAGCCKPDRRIFQIALDKFCASRHIAHMVGDSVDSDIKGAFDTGLSAILYSPVTKESQRLLFGEEGPVIHHMDQLLDHLDVRNPQSEPVFTSQQGQLVIERIGIDLVTEPRHCMHMSKEIVQSLAENIGRVLENVSEKRYISAMSCLEEMIRSIAQVAMPIEEAAIQISYPGQGQGGTSTTQPKCHFITRDHSICAEYSQLSLTADSENEATLRDIAVLLQSHCNNLMRDYPRAAIRDLRSVMLILAEKASIKDNAIIRGAKIDE